jgi:hypothetical protein
MGQGKNRATRTHRPLSKDLNLTKKTLIWQIVHQNDRKGVKKVSFKYNHGLMLFVKKNHQKNRQGLKLR